MEKVRRDFLEDVEMVESKLVSVIIVNWNGGKVFGDCLVSLAKLNYPNWELIVVDNGSTDGSVVALREWKEALRQAQGQECKILENRGNLGFAKANNQGLEVAKGDYILLLNNDTKVEPDFLEKMVKRMEEDDLVGVIQPKILMMDKPGYLDNAGSFLTRIGFLEHWGFMRRDGVEFNKEREIFSAKGACMLVRRDVIEKVGLFDSDFVSYFEESDFCWRVWLSGYKVLFFPAARIYHKVGFTIKRLDVVEINYHYYKNRISSIIKNLELRNLFLVLGWQVLISLGVAIVFMARGKPASSWIIVKAWWWNLAHIGRTLKKRLVVQKMRKLDDRELFRKVSRPVDWIKYWKDFRRVEKDMERKK